MLVTENMWLTLALCWRHIDVKTSEIAANFTVWSIACLGLTTKDTSQLGICPVSRWLMDSPSRRASNSESVYLSWRPHNITALVLKFKRIMSYYFSPINAISLEIGCHWISFTFNRFCMELQRLDWMIRGIQHVKGLNDWDVLISSDNISGMNSDSILIFGMQFLYWCLYLKSSLISSSCDGRRAFLLQELEQYLQNEEQKEFKFVYKSSALITDTNTHWNPYEPELSNLASEWPVVVPFSKKIFLA